MKTTLYPRLECFRVFPKKSDEDGKMRSIPVTVRRLWLDSDIDCEIGEEDFRISCSRNCYTISVRRERTVRQHRTDVGVETVAYEVLHQSMTRTQFTQWLTDVVGESMSEVIMEKF